MQVSQVPHPVTANSILDFVHSILQQLLAHCWMMDLNHRIEGHIQTPPETSQPLNTHNRM